MLGDYSNATIIVRSTSAGNRTGITDMGYKYIDDVGSSILNATEGVKTRTVLAWSTRLLTLKVVSINGTNLSGLNRRSIQSFIKRQNIYSRI